MNHTITWKELDDKGKLHTRTETITAESAAAALRLVECTYYWVTYPQVVREPVEAEQLRMEV